MKRVFIGIKTDNYALIKFIDEFKNNLSFEKIKWTKYENIHITLKFIGDIDDGNLNLLINKLELIKKQKKFNINIKSAGCFPDCSKPRILWFGVEHPENLNILYHEINDITGFINPGQEDIKNFHPHVTIGRIKFLKNKDSLLQLIEKYKNFVFQNQEVDKITLFQSILKPEGPAYNVISEYQLMG
ncbi:MAG: RNA 2',3'-cyclic phosphodiesterase [Marinilabiliales bacterium]